MNSVNSIINSPNNGIKLIFFLHFTFTTWAMQANNAPLSYFLYNLFILLSLFWSLAHKDSEEPLFFAVFINLLSFLFDAIIIGMNFQFIDNRWSLINAILNMILRPLTTFLLIRYYNDRSDAQIIIPLFNNEHQRSSYESIDRRTTDPKTSRVIFFDAGMPNYVFNNNQIDLNRNFSKKFYEHESFDYFDAKILLNHQNYSIQSGWFEKKIGFEEQGLRIFFNKQVDISLDEKLNFTYESFQIVFSYFMFTSNIEFYGILDVKNTTKRIFKIIPNRWTDINETGRLLQSQDKFKFKLSFFNDKHQEMFQKDFDTNEISMDYNKINKSSENKIFNNINGKEYSIYIKDMKVIFPLESKIRNSVILDLNKEIFEASIDGDRIQKNILSNYFILPKLTSGIQNYLYTFQNSLSLNWSLKNDDTKFIDDICVSFKYQADMNCSLKLKVLNNRKIKFYQLIELDSTMFRHKKYLDDIDNKQIMYFEKTKWTKVNLCLRDLFPNSEKLKSSYKLKFESFIPEDVNRHSFVAITRLQIEKKRYKNMKLKNYLTNWKTNGSSAFKEWVQFTDDSQLVIQTNYSNIQLIESLEFIVECQSYTSKKSVSLLSDWIKIEENEELKFEIDSQLRSAHYRIMLLDYSMRVVHDSDVETINQGVKNIKFKFSFTTSSLFSNKPGRIKLLITYEPYDVNLGKKLKIKNLRMSDPCHDENLCNRRGKCKTLSSNSYECSCVANYTGKNCEFKNMCMHYVKPEKIGYTYCREHNGKNCIPIGNEFMCECKDGYQWINRTLNCEYISNCLFKFCNKNELCEEDKKKKPFCRCKKNYFRDPKSNKCEYNLCKNLPIEKQCPSNEKCVTVLGEKERRCICPLENKIVNGTCLNEKYIDNPLIKQHHKCAHTYEIVDNQVVCTCYPGYDLDTKDNKSCIGDLSDYCEPKCSRTQICVLNEDTNNYECKCQIGFYGPTCSYRTNYCKRVKKEEIHHICGSDKCVHKRRDDKIGFSCVCDKYTTTENENGLCELRNVCNKENTELCDLLNAVCIAKLDKLDNFLYDDCQCQKGWNFNLQVNPVMGRQSKKCRKYCAFEHSQKEIYQDHCRINYKTNKRVWECRAGFIWNEKAHMCDAGQHLLKIKFNFKHKNFQTIDDEQNAPFEIEYSTEDYYCENSSDKIACIKKLNFNRLKESQISKDDFLDTLKNRILNSIEESLKDLFEPNLIRRITIYKLENTDPIDYSNDGLNSIYSIELYAEMNEFKKIDSIEQNLKSVCLKDNFISNANIKREINNYNDEKKNCVLRPHIYLMNSELKVHEISLCDFVEDDLGIKCKGYSNCVDEYNNGTKNYKCKCSNGFENKFPKRMHNIEFNVCNDIDECKNSTLNDCDEETTVCENFLGSFKCNCKENYKRTNNTHCELICSKNECQHGDCSVFQKNYEVCICHNGYKGARCERLDGKVVDLRTLLATISIILFLLIIMIVSITFLYVKKVESEDKEKMLKKDRILTFDHMNNNYINRIGIQNMLKHDVQQDVIDEEEISHVTNF